MSNFAASLKFCKFETKKRFLGGKGEVGSQMLQQRVSCSYRQALRHLQHRVTWSTPSSHSAVVECFSSGRHVLGILTNSTHRGISHRGAAPHPSDSCSQISPKTAFASWSATLKECEKILLSVCRIFWDWMISYESVCGVDLKSSSRKFSSIVSHSRVPFVNLLGLFLQPSF